MTKNELTILFDITKAYERRVRSICSLEDLDKKPWTCSEYSAAEALLIKYGVTDRVSLDSLQND
jgi:hypothetical protein